MATVLDVCTSAMRDIGAIAIEETPSAAEAQFCFNKLNEMISAWNNESLTVYSIINEVFPIVASQPSYTMGVGGNFNTARPIKIVDVYTRDANGNDFPVQIIDYDQYASILPKYITSPLAQMIYNDNNFPLLTLYPWPIWNNSSYSAVIWSWQAITAFPLLTTTLVLPPGYDRAIKYNLAIEISPAFGRSVSADLRDLAVTSKATIKRTNMEILQMGFDDFLLKRPGGWNWQAQCFGGVS